MAAAGAGPPQETSAGTLGSPLHGLSLWPEHLPAWQPASKRKKASSPKGWVQEKDHFFAQSNMLVFLTLSTSTRMDVSKACIGP